MCDDKSGCESVRYEGDRLLIETACGEELELEIRDYDTDEPLAHAFDGGGTKLWMDDDDRYWVGIV